MNDNSEHSEIVDAEAQTSVVEVSPSSEFNREQQELNHPLQEDASNHHDIKIQVDAISHSNDRSNPSLAPITTTITKNRSLGSTPNFQATTSPNNRSLSANTVVAKSMTALDSAFKEQPAITPSTSNIHDNISLLSKFVGLKGKNSSGMTTGEAKT